MAFIPDILRAKLDNDGHDPGAILRIWYDRGWLEHLEGRRTKRVWVGQEQLRCVAIARGVWDAVDES